MLDTKHSGRCGCDSLASQQKLMSIEEALIAATASISPISDSIKVSLVKALDLTASEEVFAPHAMPFFNNSAMDGFAVKSNDFAGDGPWAFQLGTTVAAGDNGQVPLENGKVIRIFTGAPVPEAYDAVVMVERTSQNEGVITFTHAPRKGDNIRFMGSDMPKGALLLRKGAVVSPQIVGLLAANGISEVQVVRPLRVGVLSTGDEIAESERGEGQIFDSNRPMLIALSESAGAEVTDLGILPDTLEGTKERLSDIRDEFDLVLSSGAVSMGGKDHLRPAFEAAGGNINGWRVALKPGKPIMFGQIGKTVFTGLPGNPFAAFVGFHLFVTAQISRLTTRPHQRFANTTAIANFDWERYSARAEVFPVSFEAYSDNGLAQLNRLGNSVSATLFPLAEADGLAIVPATTTKISTGDQIFWQPFNKDFLI